MLVVKARRKDPTLVAAPTGSGRRVMRALQDAMEAIRKNVDRQQGVLLDAIQHLPTDRVVDLVPTGPWFDAQEKIQNELLGEVLDGGSRVKLPSIQKAAIDFAFDRSRPEAAEWARKEGAQLVTNVVQSQRDMINSYVAQSLEDGIAPRDVARGLRNVVGLTPDQQNWVQNHYNRTYAQAVSRGLTPARAAETAQRSTDRYHSQVFRYRTETIARTEILRASHEGRREAWAQGRAEGFIPATAKKQWSTAIDDRTCDICGPLNEFTVPIDADFPDGEPPIHPNCRCDVLLLDKPDADISRMSDAELNDQFADVFGL